MYLVKTITAKKLGFGLSSPVLLLTKRLCMSVLESEHDKKYKMMDIIAKSKSSENINIMTSTRY